VSVELLDQVESPIPGIPKPAKPLSVLQACFKAKKRFFHITGDSKALVKFKNFVIFVKGKSSELVLATPDLKHESQCEDSNYSNSMRELFKAMEEVALQPDILTKDKDLDSVTVESEKAKKRRGRPAQQIRNPLPSNSDDDESDQESETILLKKTQRYNKEQSRNFHDILDRMADRGVYVIMYSNLLKDLSFSVNIVVPPTLAVQAELKIRRAAANYFNIAFKVVLPSKMFRKTLPGSTFNIPVEKLTKARDQRVRFWRAKQTAVMAKLQQKREKKELKRIQQQAEGGGIATGSATAIECLFLHNSWML
jgi:hypothetical protein